MAEMMSQINSKSPVGIRIFILGVLMAISGAPLDAKTYPRRDAVVEAFEKVSPAVVNINLEYEVRKRLNPMNEFRNPLFEEFFKDFFDPDFDRRTKRNSLGSGGHHRRWPWAYFNQRPRGGQIRQGQHRLKR